MNCRLALERSKAPIAVLRNNASSALEGGGASNSPNICWPCGLIAETATGMPIGPRFVTARLQQIKTGQRYHENPQRDCITLDRTPAPRARSGYVAMIIPRNAVFWPTTGSQKFGGPGMH